MERTNPELHMLRAVELSKRGYPAPNPHVGCVIVNEHQIVGEGWHEYWGGPHAEVAALEMAGDRARGADTYVTLEPCNHFGKRGPCSLALIEAGVRKVFIAVRDPNPIAAGGAETLSEAGLETEIGLCESEAAESNRVFLIAVRSGRPFVLAKVAITADGFLARPNGQSKWITGESARFRARQLRAQMGAVLVGVGTVLADDPRLSHRIPESLNPCVRVVLDPNGRIPLDAQMFEEPGDVIQVLSEGAEPHPRAIALVVPTQSDQFNLRDVLSALYARGIKGILVEGGAKTLASFFDSGLVDELALFQAPIEFKVGVKWLQTVREPSLVRISEESIGVDRLTLYRVG